MSDNPLILQYSDGNLVPYQAPDPAQAAQRALDFTGIPDLAAGVNALARGEWLPGLGQAAAGAGAMLPLGKLAGAAKLGAELMPLAGMVKAWHGTPHLFEPVEHNPFGEFRDAAIGTGEGAQAYGHGHYVAGNPSVAADYADKLGGGGITTLEGQSTFNHPQVSAENPHIQTAINELNAAEGDPAKAMGKIGDHMNLLNEHGQKLDWYQEEISRLQQAKEWINTNKSNIGWQPSGSLLEVHILPDEHELLDWDKPLVEQAPGVRKVIDQIHARNEDLRIKHSGPDVTGENFYLNLANQLWDKTMAGIGGGSQAASAALHEAGIPGIKYLDQGSRQPPNLDLLKQIRDNWLTEDKEVVNRQVGSPNYYDRKMQDIEDQIKEAERWKPTSNYVIFDPKNLRIVGRNGQRLEPIEDDPFK